jgi:hypothetical protein
LRLTPPKILPPPRGGICVSFGGAHKNLLYLSTPNPIPTASPSSPEPYPPTVEHRRTPPPTPRGAPSAPATLCCPRRTRPPVSCPPALHSPARPRHGRRCLLPGTPTPAATSATAQTLGPPAQSVVGYERGWILFLLPEVCRRQHVGLHWRASTTTEPPCAPELWPHKG